MYQQKVTIKELISHARNLTILFVEDDDATRVELKDFLGTFFPKIITASDGQEGWDKFNAHKIDLIVTDITLPQLTGLELISMIRLRNSTIPILILSAHTESSYLLESIKYGVDGYLLKPFDLEQFLTVVSKVVYRLDIEQKFLEYNQNLERMVEKKTYELENKYLYDQRTQLPNATMLKNDLLGAKSGYMILLDISHFSVLNKEYGKDFANKVILNTAKKLSSNIISNAKLYKVESDRFAYVVDAKMEEEVEFHCNQIISFFDHDNIVVDDVEINISFCLGADKIRDEVSETLVNCEYALDKAKEFGSRRCEIYNEKDLDFINKKESLKWLRLTRELIDNDGIEPYFQPIMDVHTGKIVKYEVLARGVYNGEVTDPTYFLNSAEKLGMLTTITRTIIKKSFLFFQDKELEFSINLTEKDLIDDTLLSYLNNHLKLYNIKPSQVTFEILENITVVKNADIIKEKLKSLQEMGFKTAVDDFGVENSNLSRFLDMHFDFIKIDGVFIKDLKKSKKSEKLTKAIVSLAKSLNMKTIAEYVTDEETYNRVKDLGVDYAQGFHVGKPLGRLVQK